MDLMARLDQFIAYLGKGKHLRNFLLSVAVLIGIIILSSGNLFDELIALFSSAFGICLFVLVAALYFLPAIKAYQDKKANRQAILVLDLLLGWTLIGWVVALVWACTKNSARPTAAVVMIPPLLCSSCGKYSRGDVAFCMQCGKNLS
jgi:hypothetical protein